jgi:flagellar basal body P-ring formation protein FlgA
MVRLMTLLFILAMGHLSWGIAPATAGSRSDVRAVSLSGQSPAIRPEAGDPRHPVVQDLSPDLIKKTIQTHLEQEWGGQVKAVQVTLLEPSEPIKLPSGTVELHVVSDASEEGLGRRLFHLAVAINGRPWKTMEVLTDVAAMIDVVSPNRFVKSDEVIDAGDLTVSRIRINQLKHPYITDQAEAIGKSPTRPLQAETPLRPSFLKTPLMMKKGDRVLIEVKRGGLSIQTYGVTKASGHIGETIMVANVDSGRELRAKIVAPGHVQVEF